MAAFHGAARQGLYVWRMRILLLCIPYVVLLVQVPGDRFYASLLMHLKIFLRHDFLSFLLQNMVESTLGEALKFYIPMEVH